MLIGALVGSLCGIAFLFFPAKTRPFMAPLASLLNIISLNAYSITVVCANAFLPSLALGDERAEFAYKEAHDSEQRPLLEDHKAARAITLSRISANSFAIGCLSAVIGLTGLEIILGRIRRCRFVLVSWESGGCCSPSQHSTCQVVIDPKGGRV